MSAQEHDHDHGHEHPHAEISEPASGLLRDHGDGRPRAADRKGADRRRRGPPPDRSAHSRTPALGAKVVARAWVDPAFKERLLADGRAACEELGIGFDDDTGLVVVENTTTVHNLIVCTLCSCYPRPVLGLPPDWYKSRTARRRCGAAGGPGRVRHDHSRTTSRSASAIRPPMCATWCCRSGPTGTDGYSEEELAALVTRDTMIGVVPATIDREDRAMSQTEQL